MIFTELIAEHHCGICATPLHSARSPSPKFLCRANVSQMPARKLLALENMSSHATDSISSYISLVSATSRPQLLMETNFANTVLST
jgi:hypothetical protein